MRYKFIFHLPMFILDQQSLHDILLSLQARANTTFTQSLHPDIDNVLGLRVPDLRTLARRIVKSGRWREYLADPGSHFMEERMLHGLVLSLIPVDDVETYLTYVSAYVRQINSWSVCDVFGFSGGKQFVADHADRLWEYLCVWMESLQEYEVRFGVVMTLQYFIDETHILPLLKRYAGIAHEGYYVRMAVAWGVSYCYISFPEITHAFLLQERLPVWTHNKAIQKVCESYRVDKAAKQALRALKRKA